MDREKELKRMATLKLEELEAWKAHVLRCKAVFVRQRNTFEIEECDFLLEHLDRRIGQLKAEKGGS